jgi:hypothetical protein
MKIKEKIDDSLKRVEIFICDNEEFIEFKYQYGIWYKIIDNKEAIKAEGWTYEDFINQVLNQYPLDSVKSFKLNNISK